MAKDLRTIPKNKIIKETIMIEYISLVISIAALLIALTAYRESKK